QEPVRTRDGGLLATADAAGGPGRRKCSLLRWLRGRHLSEGVRPRHLRAQGRLMAGLHAFSAGFTPPPGFTKRRYDWDGLFKDDDGVGVPASEAWNMLPPASVEPFRAVAAETRRVMDEWGEHPEVYGLIHGDLGVDANVLFHRGEARAIDFDDARFGYHVYDLAVALEHCFDDPEYPSFREALLEGYMEVRDLPDEQSDRLELFLSAFHVYWSLWAAAMAHVHPEHRARLGGRMERYARRVKRFLSGS
ncbi:MAG: phosphotransferase, partial [bacterium]